MQRPGPASKRPDEIAVSPHDILFECPACGKSLVVDEAAEGLSVPCAGCNISVIVPPKPQALTATQVMHLPPGIPGQKAAPSAPAKVEPPKLAAEPAKPAHDAPKAAPAGKADQIDVAALHERLSVLANQLKELQTEWTELTNRIANRINEVNRDLVQMAKLETSQKQMLAEWNQIVGQIASAGQKMSEKIPQPPTAAGSGRTKVTFGA